MSSAALAADDLPCNLGRYRIGTPSLIVIDCAKKLSFIQGHAAVSVVQDNSVTGGPVAQGTLSVADLFWIVITLDSPLKGGQDYEVELTGKAGSGEVEFAPAKFRFSTKPNAVLTLPIKGKPTDFNYGAELWIDSPVEFDLQTAGGLKFASEDAPGLFVAHTPEVMIEPRLKNPADPNYGAVGTARLTFKEGDRPKQLNSRFKITGLNTVFREEIAIKMNKRLAPASAPKGKDDAVYYSKLLHQAGVNSKPAFILDGQVAPTFVMRRLRNLQLRPSASADIGQGGAIGKVKTNDVIQVGMGVGRFIRTESAGVLQGIDPTLGIVYETNYALIHKNVLFVADARLFFAGTDHSLKQQNFLKLLQARIDQKDPTLEPQDAPKAFFGYKFRFFAGTETGAQISDETAQASSGDSSITVPRYGIARITPKAELDLELGRFTLNLSGTARYLFQRENVYRERDVLQPSGQTQKQVYLDSVHGFRPAGEVGLSFSLDDAGHYALSSALKLGSLPPNFERVATVQSGLTIKF